MHAFRRCGGNETGHHWAVQANAAVLFESDSQCCGKYFEANALNAAWRTREAAVNDFFCQPHRFKDLGALVTLQGRDPHFGHYLKHAFGDTLAIAGNNLFIGP